MALLINATTLLFSASALLISAMALLISASALLYCTVPYTCYLFLLVYGKHIYDKYTNKDEYDASANFCTVL